MLLLYKNMFLLLGICVKLRIIIVNLRKKIFADYLLHAYSLLFTCY